MRCAASNASRIRDVVEDRATRAAERAERAADVASAAAGAAGSKGMAGCFEECATGERRAADLLRTATVTLLSLLIAGSSLLVVAGHGYTPVEVLLRLALVLPVAVLAAYLAKEATRHRRSADWAAELEVELPTLPAYTEKLERTDQAEYRRALGRGISPTARPPEAPTSSEVGPRTT